MEKVITTADLKEIIPLEDQLMPNGQQRLMRSLFVTSQELKAINLFWIGFILHSVGYTLSTTYIINVVIFQAVQLLGLGLFFYGTIRLVKFKFENLYLQFFFVLYMCWTVFVLVRGIDINFYNIKLYLLEPYEGIMVYFTPIILLLPKNLLFYKKTFDAAVILGIFYFLHDVIVLGELLNRGSDDGKGFLEVFTKSMALPVGLIMLTYAYHPLRRKFLAIAVLGLGTLLSIYRARRSLMLMAVNPLLFGYLLYLINSKKKLMILFFSGFIAIFLSLFAESFLNKDNDSGLFSRLMERGMDDTRSGVEECLYNDMKPIDWIIGKGMGGMYYCPNIEVDGTKDYRTGIESDYLNTILKGGIVYLSLMLLIILPAIFKGIFQSNNLLSKAAGLWVFFYFLYLYPAPVTKFNANYLMVWICIGICYTPMIRNMSEKMIRAYFKSEISI